MGEPTGPSSTAWAESKHEDELESSGGMTAAAMIPLGSESSASSALTSESASSLLPFWVVNKDQRLDLTIR